MNPRIATPTIDTPTIAVMARLVAFPTESRTPNRELIDWVANRMSAFGGRVTLVGGPDAEDRTNLLASFGPVGPGGLMLSGHSDVVPAGPGWASDPWTVTDRAGRLHGRGTADMKGFIASALVAVERLAGTTLRAPLHVALSFDEEVGCIGVRHLLDRLGADGEVRPSLVVIGEPTMMQPRHRHLGKVGYEVEFLGASGHSSLSYRLPSAISSASRVIAALDAVGRVAADAAGGSEPDVTVNCGVIEGGAGLNVIAERCRLSFELRHAAERDPDVALTPVRDVLAAEHAVLGAVGRGVEVIEIVRYPGLATDADHPMVKLVERVADAGVCRPLGYGTEGGLFAATIDAPVVICGPGDIAVAHRPDEYVTAEQLTRCDHFLTGLIERVCRASG